MKAEPLVSDQRLEPVEDMIRRRFPALPLDADFVTYIQPPKQSLDGKVHIPSQAVFAIVADNPSPVIAKNPLRSGERVMVSNNIRMSDWRKHEADKSHFAGVPDYLYLFFFPLAVAMLEKLDHYRSQIS